MSDKKKCPFCEAIALQRFIEEHHSKPAGFGMALSAALVSYAVVASNSRRRASASACARASSSCFKRASAAALRAFFSLENPTRARTTATATPEANSPIPSGRKVKEHTRNSVAATKRAIEDFFILIPLSNCKFLRQNSPILTFNTIIRPPCAKIKNKAEYSHTLCK